jgi:DNA processing protein
MPLVIEENEYRPSEEKYWIAFSRVSGIGLMRLQRLESYFGGLEAAWKAATGDLMAAGLEPKLIERTLIFRNTFEPDQEQERMASLGIQAFYLHNPLYPARLRQIENPPPVLYIKGNLTATDGYALGVVGTRRATSYGREVTNQIVTELAQQGMTIVSGLALGIDTYAHHAAIKAGGRTIAVLGCGADIPYPQQNVGLAKQISDGQGALISEYPPGTKPEPANFPPRNRIISGLSRGVLVVESGAQGGALITVDFANEQGRDVFAVPGSIFSRFSDGTNTLLRQGAKAVTSAADILEDLNLTHLSEQAAVQEVVGTNDVERALLRVLANEPLHIDEICLRSGLSMGDVSAALMMMEIKGMIRNLGTMRYVVAKGV